ncbi:MAG: hypothetical protein ACYCY9_13645 [Thiobacillus sp.]
MKALPLPAARRLPVTRRLLVVLQLDDRRPNNPEKEQRLGRDVGY